MSYFRIHHRLIPAIARVLCICLFLAYSPALLSASGDTLLIAEFSAETHPLIRDTAAPPTRDEIIRSLLHEAQYVFSGMVYGFNFVYTPADPARKVSDAFDLKLIAEIPWGDPRMSVLDTRTANGLFFARITYRPADFQVARWEAWQSNSNAHASGEGKASYLKGSPARRTAVEEAVKNAIRRYVSGRIYSRPREISGSLALLDAPRIIVQTGNYVATVRIALDVRSVKPYTVF